MLDEFDPKIHDLDEVGIRRTNTLKVATGPTVMKGRINGAADSGALSAEPEWWKENE